MVLSLREAKFLFRVLGYSLLVVSTNVFAGLAEGIAAYNQGDDVTAFREFKQLAEQGHAVAQFNLGVMYYQRGIVPQDYAQAVHWFRKAAEQGHAKAQEFLGAIYSRGKGVSHDAAQAAHWYHRAAEQGQISAQITLGYLYVLGHGVPQDYVEAHKWLNLAATRGDKAAERDRDELEEIMFPTQIARAQRLARNWRPKQSSPTSPTSEAKKSLIKDIQKNLNILGYDAGPVDGMLRPRTKAAIRKFQRSLGIHPTGQPSQELLVLLKKALDDKSLSAH